MKVWAQTLPFHDNFLVLGLHGWSWYSNKELGSNSGQGLFDMESLCVWVLSGYLLPQSKNMAIMLIGLSNLCVHGCFSCVSLCCPVKTGDLSRMYSASLPMTAGDRGQSPCKELDGWTVFIQAFMDLQVYVGLLSCWKVLVQLQLKNKFKLMLSHYWI